MTTSARHTSPEGTAVAAQPPDQDHRLLGSSLLGTVAFGALASVYSFLLYPFQFRWEHGTHLSVWYQAGDVWSIVDAGRFVWQGALGYVYEGSGGSYALPTSYVLVSPLSALIDHYHWVEGLFPIPRPSAWPAVCAFVLVWNVFLLDAIRRLAWDLGVRERLWMIQVASVVVVCVPVFQFGHFEDLLALVFLLHAVRFHLKGGSLYTFACLSVAITFKQWALLAVPLLVLLAPWGRRIIGLIVSASLPVLFTAIVLLTDPKHGLSALFSPMSPKKTDPGHVSFFLTWFGSRTSQMTRSASVLISPVIAYLFRNVRRREGLLAALSVILLIRPLFEPSVYSYYWMPSLLIAGLVGTAAHRRIRVRDWMWQGGVVIWALPHSNPHTETLWWSIEFALIVLTWAQVGINCGIRCPRRRPKSSVHGDRSDSTPLIVAS
jgi:hypothetical protein